MTAISNWKRWAGFLVMGLLTMPGAAQTSAPVRVALWATTLNADSEKYLDVAVAELTARGGIELVERQAIRAVLGEQSQALQQDASGVAAGKLLRADVIAVLETTPDGKEAGGFAVLDTATGVSYWNQGLESSGVEDVAREIVRGVTAALEKRGRAGSLSTVCMLGARNAEFPRSLDVFCETVAYLLDRRLVENLSVTTLDRRRLETVISENRLPGVEDKGDVLLPSLRLVELDFRRGASEDEIKVLARVTDAGGALIAQPEVTGPVDAVELENRLQEALAEVLRATPQKKTGNRAKEANRFRGQGKILWDRELWDSSLQAYAAAVALDGTNQEWIGEYQGHLAEIAKRLSKQGDYDAALKACGRLMDVGDAYHTLHAEAGKFNRDPLVYALKECRSHVRPESSLWEEYSMIRLRYMRALGLTTNPQETGWTDWDRSSVLGVGGGVPVYYPLSGSELLHFRVWSARYLCLNADEFLSIFNSKLEPWLDRETDTSRPHDEAVVSTLYNLSGRNSRDRGKSWIPDDGRLFTGLYEIARRLMAHPRLVVRLEGMYFDLLLDSSREQAGGSPASFEEYKKKSRKIVDLALAGAATTNTPYADIPLLYEIASRAVDEVFKQNWSIKEGEAWRDENIALMVQGMFDNHQISGPLLEMMENKKMDFHRYRLPALRRLKSVQHDRTYRWMRLPRGGIQGFLRALPSSLLPVAAESGVRLLWQTPDPGSQCLKPLAVPNESVMYAFRGSISGVVPSGKGTNVVELLRLDLKDGRIASLDELAISARWGQDIRGVSMRVEGDFIEDSLLTGDRLWLATYGDGLWGVSLREGTSNCTHLNMANGLPSDAIHAVAEVGDSFYIGCGRMNQDGYIVRYDRRENHCHIMASTVRTSPECPLDSMSNGFHVVKIVHDAPRNRLLLAVNGSHWMAPASLWEYQLDTGRWNEILVLDRKIQSLQVGLSGKLHLVICARRWNQNGWFGGAVFDPESDAGQLVYTIYPRNGGPRLPVTDNTLVHRNMLRCVALEANGWIYHFAENNDGGRKVPEFRRISLDAHEVQSMGVPVGSNVEYHGWMSWLPRSGVLLVGDGRQLQAVKIGEEGVADE